MKKNLTKRLGALVLALTMVLALSACGKTFDAAGYVDANMKLVTTGDGSALEAYTKEASTDMEEEYQEEMDGIIEDLLGQADLPESLAQEFSDLLKEIMASASYSVGEAKENDDGSFDVPMTIKPLKLNIAQDMTEWVNNLDYSKYDLNDMDAIYEDIFKEVAKMMKDAVAKKEYDTEKEYTIHVAKNEDGVYEADEETLSEIGANLFTTDLGNLME